MEGRPQAFVDFFRLTHGTADTAASGGGINSATGELQHESLLLLKSQLAEADVARRQGRVEDMYGAYKHLARYFVQLGKLSISEFFFKQCLAISKQAGWLPGELEASLALGMVYEELQDTAAAIACHEHRLDLATTNNLQVEVETALASLAKTYMRHAEEHEKQGDAVAASDAFSQCLRAADKVGDTDSATKANHKLGLLCAQQERWQDAIFYLRRYIELSAGSADVPGMGPEAPGVAHTTYARCLQQCGDIAGAMQSLEAYLHSSTRCAS